MTFKKSEYANNYAKENYYRIPVNVPKAWEIPIKARAKEYANGSISAYIKRLIEEDIKSRFTNGGGEHKWLAEYTTAAYTDSRWPAPSLAAPRLGPCGGAHYDSNFSSLLTRAA